MFRLINLNSAHMNYSKYSSMLFKMSLMHMEILVVLGFIMVQQKAGGFL